MSVVLPPFIAHFATLAGDYDVALCDVWGVVHNGVVAAPEACDALTRFRERGGTVVLITNAPRPGERVARTILDRLGVPSAAYDGIISSGDVTRALIAARAGARVFHIGPERDLPLFDGLDSPMAPLERADYVVCSGLLDDTVETPRDYEELVARMHARALPMICANPDVVVERGDKLVYCAGAIADLYAAAGGDVVYAGKPYRPIYEQALASRRGRARPACAAASPAGDRRFGAHRPQGRRGIRHRCPVRDRGYSRRGTRRPQRSRCRHTLGHLRGGGRGAESRHAPAELVDRIAPRPRRLA